MRADRSRSAASAAIAITLGATLSVVGWTVANVTPAAAAPTVTATMVRTIDTSTLNPPIPDPAGIVYVAARDHFLISDSEVDETPVFQNANVFETTRTGTVVDTGLTTPQTKEAAGIGHSSSNNHAYVSDDDQFRVHEFAPGPDGRYATADDTRTFFSTSAFGSTDPEDVAYYPPTGELFVLDGADHDVHRINPGPNGRFDGVAPTGDDTATEFDVQRYGAEDPEGIGFHPGRGTLVVVDSTSEAIYELNRELMLISTVDISASNQLFAAGITVAPATDDPDRFDFYIVDRGVDNDSDPDENDGRIYEMRAALPPIVNLAPDVSAGRDAPVTVGAPLQLRATVRDDGQPGPGTSVAWSRVSGPGVVNFAAPDQPQTTAAFSAPGTYVLRATATDGALSSSDDVTVTVVPVGAPLPLDTPVAKAFDDVEQRPTGFADWLGSTLNIPRAGTTAQTIGIRFADLAVPSNATITEAWIQFRATGSNSGATSVQIRGIDQDDTATFTTSSTTVSSRPLTTATSTWSPAAWTNGQAGAAQRTTDLSQIVQEIVDRPAWQSGNALAFSMTGTGERRASSHDSVQAPVLHLAYTTPTQTNTPPVAAFTSQCSGLSCTFDGTGSSDAQGPIAGYEWTFPGDTATGPTAQHTFAAPGTYDVTLTVTDSAGATGSVTHPVTVSVASSGIGFRAVTRSINNATSSTVTVPAAVRAGDALLLFATINASDTAVTPPAGWTQAANFVNSTQRTLVWQRVATSTDPGRAITVGLGTTTKIVLQLAAYSGTSTTDPVAALTTRAEPVKTVSHGTPPATVTGDGGWVVSYWADKSATTTDWVPPAGATARDESIGSGSGRITALLADTGPVPPGSWPGLTATTNETSRASTVTVVLRPGSGQPPANTLPVAAFTSQCAGLSCTFDGTGSSDAEGPIAGYQWAFAGGGTASGPTAQHTFGAPGTYDVTLTVTDSAGATGSITHPVTVSVTAPTIGFRAVTRSINNSTTSTVTVPTAVRTDDALLLFATVNATDTVVTPPAGWTQVANFVTSSQRTLVWQRVATATDPGRAITVGLDTTTKIVLQLAAYGGTSSTNPVAALVTRSETVRTSSHPTPPATVSGDGRWVVSYWADKSSTTTDWVPPAGATSRDEAIGSGSGRIATLLADTGPVPSGAWPGLTAATNDDTRAATITLVLNPS